MTHFPPKIQIQIWRLVVNNKGIISLLWLSVVAFKKAGEYKWLQRISNMVSVVAFKKAGWSSFFGGDL